MKKNNMSVITTKSGTKVYVVGTFKDKLLRDKIGDEFVNYFNRDFTIAEQKEIGNIYYDVYNRNNSLKQIPRPKMNRAEWIAQTGTFTGDDAKKLNPGYPKMVDVSFKAEARDDEGAVTHELIHAKKFMGGIPGTRHNERKIDFEMVGRISPKGIHNLENGYYFSPEGNAALRSKRGITLQQKGEIAKRGVIDDRLLLTGSVRKQMIGKPIAERSNKLFRKSFFLKKKF